MIKAKLYDMLAALIQFNQPMILAKLLSSKILNFLLIDYDRYENNPTMLILLNSVVKQILLGSNLGLKNKLLFDLKLLDINRRKLESSDYKLS